MPISELGLGTIVRVPFPYTSAESRQHRPALVVATAGSDDAPFLLWVLMVTAAENRRWDGDVAIPDAVAAGLPIPSVVRTAKIATIGLARAEPRGQFDPETLAAVRAAVGHRLGL
jgi:mRNA interferase MazF